MAMVRPAAVVAERLGHPASTWLCERLWLTPMPRHPKLRPREEALAREAVHLQVPVEGGHVAAWRWGQGERAVLLLHGWGGYAMQLSAFVRPLVARGLTVAAFDFPSHGASDGKRTDLPAMARAMAAVAKALPPLEAIVAHSFGGVAAVLAVSRGAPDVKRLAILAGPAHFHTAEERFKQMTGLSSRTFDRMRRNIERRTGEQWERLQPMALVHALGKPGLVVQSDDDAELPITHAETLARLWPEARLDRRQGLGHFRLLRDPSVVEDVVAFVSPSSGEGKAVP
ncbi:MAG TPA: alpha/beta fold hydrolase [Myxococcaceae bacterium]|nr:alpha/beta fold hydrolase [Myxococcaceae bacterium]